MAQHDMNIANQGFPATRSDLNNALQALVSNSSGASAPSTTFANQWWYDTTNNKMYIRNEANNAWIEVFTLDQTNNEWQLTTGVVQAKDSDGLALKTDDGTTRLFIKDSDGSIGIGTTSPDGPLHIETTGNETQITLESTDADATTGPNMTFKRTSASPADGDQTGSVFFIGEDDAGNDTTYASLTTHIVDASNGTEDGRLTLSSMSAGSSTDTLSVVSGKVGIGLTDPNNTLTVKGGAHQLDVETSSTGVTLESIDRAATSDSSDIGYYARNGVHKFFTNGYIERLEISNGTLKYNGGTQSYSSTFRKYAASESAAFTTTTSGGTQTITLTNSFPYQLLCPVVVTLGYIGNGAFSFTGKYLVENGFYASTITNTYSNNSTSSILSSLSLSFTGSFNAKKLTVTLTTASGYSPSNFGGTVYYGAGLT